MTQQSSENIAIKLIQEAIEAEGCYIQAVDFENLTIKLNGPDKIVGECARAVAELLD